MKEISRFPVSEFLLRAEHHTLVDVRSPGEYAHAHIPGAINAWLFDDEERAAVGTLYVQQGRIPAMEKGLEYYGRNMLRILQQLKDAGAGPELFVHCWRGGMRSGVVAWMLQLFGYKVSVLDKGYKAYRQYVLQQFEKSYKLCILGGRTGSAKTPVLRLLGAVAQVVNLEGLAGHKGSAFGALGEQNRPGQEMFENLLAMELLRQDSQQVIWMEDESQRIGDVNIPNHLVEQMKCAPVWYMDVPMEERLQYLVDTYGLFGPEDLKKAASRLRKRLGDEQMRLTLQYLEERNFSEAFRILLRYYDKYYDLGLNRRVPSSVHRVGMEKIDPERQAALVLQHFTQK